MRKQKTELFKFVDNYILECETDVSEIQGRYNDDWHDINIIEMLGMVEEKATLYGCLLVEIKGVVKEVSFNLLNRWAYVYKDEQIEVSEDLGTAIIESFYK